MLAEETCEASETLVPIKDTKDVIYMLPVSGVKRFLSCLGEVVVFTPVSWLSGFRRSIIQAVFFPALTFQILRQPRDIRPSSGFSSGDELLKLLHVIHERSVETVDIQFCLSDGVYEVCDALPYGFPVSTGPFENGPQGLLRPDRF